MKFIFAIFLSLIFFLMINGQNIPDLNNNSSKAAQELWEKVIAAKGGRENLYAINNLLVSTKSYNPFEEKEFQNSKSEELFVLSGKWWAWTDDRPGFTLSIWQYDFEREIGYEVTEGHEFDINKPNRVNDVQQGKSAEELKIAKLENERFYYVKRKFFENQLVYLMETKWFQPKIERVQIVYVKGRKANVIEVLFGDLKIEYYISPKTFLPFYIKRSVWFDYKKAFGAEDEISLEDYIEVAGIKFPQVIRRGKKTDMKTKYQVNVKHKENLFDTPPSIEAGIDAWKLTKNN